MNKKRNFDAEQCRANEIEQCKTTERWTSSKLKTSYFLNGHELSKSQWYKAIKERKHIKINKDNYE